MWSGPVGEGAKRTRTGRSVSMGAKVRAEAGRRNELHLPGVTLTNQVRLLILPPRRIMVIERTETEVIIRLPASVSIEALQSLLDFLRFQELTTGISATQADADALAKEAKHGWWAANHERLLG